MEPFFQSGARLLHRSGRPEEALAVVNGDGLRLENTADQNPLPGPVGCLHAAGEQAKRDVRGPADVRLFLRLGDHAIPPNEA